MSFVAELLNFALSLVFWATLGRILLTLMVGPRDNFFLGVLRKATDSAYGIAARVLPERWVPLGVLVGTLLLRLALVPFMRPS